MNFDLKIIPLQFFFEKILTLKLLPYNSFLKKLKHIKFVFINPTRLSAFKFFFFLKNYKKALMDRLKKYKNER